MSAIPAPMRPATRQRGTSRADGPRALGRVRSLDGLRGLAAIIVVIHHSALAVPAAEEALDAAAPIGSAAWWLTYSPLHVFWAGEEAVLIFFVLSGFVLALPATVKAMRWRVYYVKRLLRIYVPVWGSLIFAMILAVLTRTTPSSERSSYVNSRSDVSLAEAPMDALLVTGAGLLNGPLWSLQWEMIFSLLLPAYLLLAYPTLGGRHRGALPLVALALFGLIALGTLLGSGALRFLPMFGIGVLMAFNQEALQSGCDWLARRARPRLAWGLVAALTLILLTGRWIAMGLPVESRLLAAAGSGASFLGACLAVFLALHWPAARALLERRSWQWLGTVSFSLYVIHEPIVVATALLLPPDVVPWGTPLIAIPLALLAATAFFRLVEGPAHSLARAVGRKMTGSHRSAQLPT
jgi:peptidoglycan/LPS O-acetylase OafA/YrhL